MAEAARQAVRKLLNTKINLVHFEKEVIIDYSYHLRRRTQAYNLCIYNSELLGKNVPVFVQEERGKDPSYTIDKEFQFGVDGEIFFLVNHDSTRRSHGIYQWRFFKEAGGLSTLKSFGIEGIQALGGIIGSKIGVSGLNLDFIAGDPLRDF